MERRTENGAIDPLFELVEPDVRLALELGLVLAVLHPRRNEIGADRNGTPHADRDDGRDKGAKAAHSGGLRRTNRCACDSGGIVVSRHIRRAFQTAG